MGSPSVISPAHRDFLYVVLYKKVVLYKTTDRGVYRLILTAYPRERRRVSRGCWMKDGRETTLVLHPKWCFKRTCTSLH